MKKSFILFCLFFLIFSLEAQQITRVAVVDLPKVYTAFFKESKAVKDFEASSNKVQAEVDKMKKEIQDLQNQQADAALKNDTAKASKLESDIIKKSNFLQEYFKLKTAELEDQKKKLSSSSTFLEQLNNEIRFIAESEGYSMVLNKSDNQSLLWYSQSIDITDKLVNNLRAKSKH
ncbi:MAG: OmpH family outer membrane protein [Termitinemataceae bacterium]|nr:MAG: OmpH family outer membrane protein [Termitinemataceae bacterium]